MPNICKATSRDIQASLQSFKYLFIHNFIAFVLVNYQLYNCVGIYKVQSASYISINSYVLYNYYIYYPYNKQHRPRSATAS